VTEDSREAKAPRILPRRGWKVAAQVALVAVLLGFLAWQLVRNWRDIGSYTWHLNAGWAAGAMALLLVCLAADVAIWNFTLGRLGGQLSFRRAAPIYLIALVARYVPGKVTSLAARMLLTEKEGISRARALASILLELLLRLVAALIVFAATLPSWLNVGDVRKTYPLLLVIPLALIALHPAVLQRALDLALRRMHRELVRVPFSYGDVVAITGFLCVRWLVYGLGFYCLAAALTPGLRSILGPMIGMVSAGWAVGFLSMVPAGLGVNEALLWVILTRYTDPGVAAVIPIMARMWLVIGEIIALGIAFAFSYRSRPRRRQGRT
jgi:hypothetical protein